MEGLNEYLIPYIISNMVFAASIIAAVKQPYYSRIFFILLFLWASYTNFTTAFSSPEVYLDYGKLALLPFYKDIINGFFAIHIQQFVFLIAFCQLMIAAGLMFNKTAVNTACTGGIIFGLAIAPLGVGSAFPATVFMAIALFILMRKNNHNHIWKTKQYKLVIK